ncbi:MAG: hypothetical protein M0D57_22080 [Sphingobacteriales bacterium JAD_PAG50586_3]|nr:MAG: hypothetical protein M0D57_22080 [Sphingobacteriales bacterium JAD_PAG50586_3]
MSIDAGDIMITTVDLPEGGIGTYKPRFTNIHLSYAKAFSNSIYGGIAVKIINEAIPDVSAMGFAFDAGVQYVTGKKKISTLVYRYVTWVHVCVLVAMVYHSAERYLTVTPKQFLSVQSLSRFHRC